MKKRKVDLSQFTAEEIEQAKKESRAEFRAGLVFLYFVLAFAATVYATDQHALTYAQISFVYLPMFFVFIYWLIQRLRDPSSTKHTRAGNIIGIGMCIFIIVATIMVTVASWGGML